MAVAKNNRNNKTSNFDHDDVVDHDDVEYDHYNDDVEVHNYAIDETTFLTASDEIQLMTLQEKAKMFDLQSAAANRLSIRLLNTLTEEEEDQILRETLDLSLHPKKKTDEAEERRKESFAKLPIGAIVILTLLFFAGLAGLMILGLRAVGPPNRPVGPYTLVERQVSLKSMTIIAKLLQN